ncbi:MAG: hypothetical protein IJ365_02895, partial [Clostridia bacterium]|nr:hypothetical protein [Clostridia bacterium]
MKRLISMGLIFIITMLSIMPATVLAAGEEAASVFDFASLVNALPGDEDETGREDFAAAKYLPAQVTANFSETDMTEVESSDTVVLSFAVKAVSKSTALDISVVKADGTTVAMTYYAPVQWTSINMPMVGPLRTVTLTTTADAVLLGSATIMDKDSTALSDPSLKGGMWMLDSFDTYVLDEAAAVGSDSIDLVKSGSYVYTIGSNGVLTVTDVSDINNPVVRGTLDLGASLRQIALCKSGTDVMISARQDGAFIVDVSDPTNPKIRSRYDTIEFATGMHIYDDYAYISCRQFGVEVVDISNLDNPKHLSIVRCGEAQSCEVVGGILYAGLWGECA